MSLLLSGDSVGLTEKHISPPLEFHWKIHISLNSRLKTIFHGPDIWFGYTALKKTKEFVSNI